MRPEVGRIQSLGLVMACAAIAACAPAKITTTVSPALEQYQVRSIVVMPFDRLMTPQILDSPESQFSVPRGARRSDIQIPPAPSRGHLDRETSTVPSVVPEKIGDMVYRNLVKRGGLQVRPQEEAAAAIRATGSGAPDTLPQQTAKDVIRNTRSDAALLGRVWSTESVTAADGGPIQPSWDLKLDSSARMGSFYGPPTITRNNCR